LLAPTKSRCSRQEAVEASGGKVPAERVVKDAVLRYKSIVERLKRKNPPPPDFVKDDMCKIKAGKHSPLRQFDGMWRIIEHVGSYSCTVRISIAKDEQHCHRSRPWVNHIGFVRISIAKDEQHCKGEEMTRIDQEYTSDIKVVGKRVAALVKFGLEPVEYAILEVLQHSTCFTPKQMLLLAFLEQQYRAESKTSVLITSSF
jgi:hypothetical protein